jgi:hypothetical protein
MNIRNLPLGRTASLYLSLGIAMATLSACGGGGGGSVSASGSSSGSGGSGSSCSQSGSSVVFTHTGTGWSNNFDYRKYGLYNVNFNDWGPDPGTLTQWINGATCWATSSTTTNTSANVSSYPNVHRGWTNNATLMQAQSSSGYPNTPNWTTLSGMGIQASALTKAHVKWDITVPSTATATTTSSRWNALIDVYLHESSQGGANPSSVNGVAWPPKVDIQIMQMIMDQPLTGQPAATSGFYASTMTSAHYFVKTFSGVTYIGAIDMSGAYNVFNSTGGHTITMMVTPTMPTNPSTSKALLWGQTSVVHDVDAIISWFSQSNPLDDSGNSIKNASGVTVSSPVIDPTWYLTAINAGFEIVYGNSSGANNQWKTNNFWVAMQSEADGN